MHTPDPIQVGDRVLILRPAYVAGKVGVVRGRESRSDAQPSNRWLIQVKEDTENIVVSLLRNEFEVIRTQLE